MVHIELYLKGARDYTLLEGPTGPCVYPAGYVYAYRALHWATDGGRDIRLAQWLFAALYSASLALVCAVYWSAKVSLYHGDCDDYAGWRQTRDEGGHMEGIRGRRLLRG
jgi:hypothetical protein